MVDGTATRTATEQPARSGAERRYIEHPDAAMVPARSAVSAALTVALLAGAVGAVALATRSYLASASAYVDNGDGYYLYAAWRLAHGAVLYRDVMGTQPPLVYLLAAAIFKLGGTLPALRLTSAALRGLTTLLVFLVGRRLLGRTVTAALGAAIYALLPIGLAWDRSFDVNPPLTLLALLAVWPLLYDALGTALIAGLLATLALFTKNLYLPILAATLLYLAVQRRRLLAPYLGGLLGGLALAALALAAYAGPAGPRDAFLGQGSSPFNAQWLVAALAYVTLTEGGIVLAAIAGAALCWQASRGKSFAPWWLAGSCAILLATIKEGTAGPVFQIAEPAVALLAAYAVAWVWHELGGLSPRRSNRGRVPREQTNDQGAPASGRGEQTRVQAGRSYRPIAALVLPALLGLSLAAAVGLDHAALSANNAAEVMRVAALVRGHTRPGAEIVAPPYYALLSGTRLPGDAADTYIVAQRVRSGDPWARRWLRNVTTALANRRIPVVLLDLRLAAIAPLMAALRAHYRPVYSDTLPPALHVVVWLPRRSG